MEKIINKIRKLIADYMSSEGCSCCEDTEKHNEVKSKMAKLLNVPMYKDKSGYDFKKFRTKISPSIKTKLK